MSTVTLTIGSKSYNIACADGEEPRITMLGAMIAEKYAQLGSARAPLEAQNLLFAALFLADELAEARKLAAAETKQLEALRATIAQLEDELAEAREAAAAETEELEALQATIAQLEDDLAAAHEAAALAARAPAPEPSPIAAPILGTAPQRDLFGGPGSTPDLAPELIGALAERLEALAERAEANAAALEAAAANA